jgi:hypothetical protein
MNGAKYYNYYMNSNRSVQFKNISTRMMAPVMKKVRGSSEIPIANFTCELFHTRVYLMVRQKGIPPRKYLMTKITLIGLLARVNLSV